MKVRRRKTFSKILLRDRYSFSNNAFYPLIAPLIEKQTLHWWHANWIPLSDHKKENCVEKGEDVFCKFQVKNVKNSFGAVNLGKF